MRSFHRILAILCVAFMLYLGVTGTLIQTLDLNAVVGGAPETDATMQSINEGKFGSRDHTVLTPSDYGAAALPVGLDIPKAFATSIAALRKIEPTRNPDFFELRMVEGRIVGQARYGKNLRAVDALTGTLVEPLELKPANPPKSARQTLKEWHRFWGPTFPTMHRPGVFIELAAGLALSALLLTGLVMYWRLYRQRRKLKLPNPVWLAGGLWRGLHRATSVVASVFLICVVLSGTWLGFESTWNTLIPRTKPVDPTPLDPARVPAMVDATLTAMQAQESGVAVRVLRVREYFGYPHGVVITKEAVTRQIVFDTRDGRQLNLYEPGYPTSRFPLEMDVHEAAKHFHSGYMFGVPARVMSLIAGLALVYLSISGIAMYVEMYRKRRAGGRKGLLWT